MSSEPTLEHLLSPRRGSVVDGRPARRRHHRAERAAWSRWAASKGRATRRLGGVPIAQHRRDGARRTARAGASVPGPSRSIIASARASSRSSCASVEPALVITTTAEVEELGGSERRRATSTPDPTDDAVVLVHRRIDRSAQGRAPHPSPLGVQGASHGRRSMNSRRATSCSCLRRSRTSPDCSTASSSRASIGMTTVLLDRWSPSLRSRSDRARTGVVHGRTSDVLRRSHGRPDVLHRARRVTTARLVGRRRRRDEFVERARRELGAVVKRSYGSTEAPTVATSSSVDDPALGP